MYRVTIRPVALVLVSGILFLSPACSSAGGEEVRSETSPTSTVPAFSGGPRIFFEEDFIDLGEATPEQKLHAEFRFQNIGDAPLAVYETTKEVLEGC